MEDQSGKTAFDAEKEVEELQNSAKEQSSSRAYHQLIVVMACTFLVAVVALALIMFAQKCSPQGLEDDTRIEWDGKTFELIEKSADIAALGIATPLNASECGQRLATLDKPSSLKGATLYRPKSNTSASLLITNKQGQYSLFQFCYFTDSTAHSGQDILDIYGSDTKLKAIDCYGINRDSVNADEWEKTVTDQTSLEQFESSFGLLKPMENTRSLIDEINKANAWDVLVTIRYENGISFNLCIYKQLKAVTGFRCVYGLPDGLAELFSKKA